MALYKCKHPKCRGHHTFSATCPEPVFQGYSALNSFIEGHEIKLIKPQPAEPLEAITADQPSRAVAKVGISSSDTIKDYMKFWRGE